MNNRFNSSARIVLQKYVVIKQMCRGNACRFKTVRGLSKNDLSIVCAVICPHTVGYRKIICIVLLLGRKIGWCRLIFRVSFNCYPVSKYREGCVYVFFRW